MVPRFVTVCQCILLITAIQAKKNKLGIFDLGVDGPTENCLYCFFSVLSSDFKTK